MYDDAKLVGVHCHNRMGVVSRVEFSAARLGGVDWGKTKRLMYGSLVVLSPDNFTSPTLFWGTVANKDEEAMNACAGRPRIDIALYDRVEQRDGTFSPDTTYVLITRPAFVFLFCCHCCARVLARSCAACAVPFLPSRLVYSAGARS